MRRLLVLAAAAAAVVPSTAARGGMLCYEVARTGTLGPPVHLFPVCVPLVNIPVTCQSTDIDTTTLNVIHLDWCVPR